MGENHLIHQLRRSMNFANDTKATSSLVSPNVLEPKIILAHGMNSKNLTALHRSLFHSLINLSCGNF
jgi:hypothetical protein